MLAIFVVPRPFTKLFAVVDTLPLTLHVSVVNQTRHPCREIYQKFSPFSLCYISRLFICSALAAVCYHPKGFRPKKRKKIKSFFHPCTMDAKLCFQHFQHLSYDVTRYPFAFMYFPVKMKIREKSQLETFAASLKAILIRFNKLFFCIFLYICICVVLYISFYYSLFRYNSIIIINIFELIFQPNIFTYNPMNCTRG